MDTLVPEIVALKTIAAYRSGLDIDTHVSEEVAERSLAEVLLGKQRLHVGPLSYDYTNQDVTYLFYDHPLTLFLLQLESLSVLETKA